MFSFTVVDRVEHFASLLRLYRNFSLAFLKAYFGSLDPFERVEDTCSVIGTLQLALSAVENWIFVQEFGDEFGFNLNK